MIVVEGVGARRTTPFAIHFSRTAELMPLIAAKSFLEIVGEVARVVSCKLIEFTIVADRADSKAGSNWDTTDLRVP